MESKNGNEAIKEIVDIINEKANDETVTPEEEFEFGKKEKESGLVFESVPVDDLKKVEREREEKEKITSTIPEAEQIEPTPEESSSESDEFSLPDIFEVSEKYNTPATPDVSRRIRTTYVPRFTEASEKYRVRSDPRKKNPQEPKTPVATRVDSVSADDPTAEIENNVAETVIVRSAPVKEEKTESVNIYKFDSDEPLDEETVAKEIEEIENLIGKEPDPEPAVEEVTPEPEEEPVDEDVAEPAEEKKIELPDPEPSELSVVDYNKPKNDTELTAPDGATNLPVEADKNHYEFTHTTQRDSFKDKFLDSIMSVKIRFFATVLFAALLLVYETLAAFGVLTSVFPGIALGPTALGIVDLVFVVGLFALVVPEVLAAIRHLLVGRVVSDIMLIPALIVTVAYSLVLALHPSSRIVILLGFVFATLVLSVISGAYLRLKGDFTAFKVISKNGEKRILDRKLTRELPEENMALDGLVDEYKSRTARIFRAGFITDFFKKSARSSEISKHTLKILAISLGVAFVTGVVCFFVGGGIVAALAAFALVFLLGIPALTIVTHKLPYAIAQRAALDEESTVVGESSYGEFAEVDVIAFKDTEIFGTDDVNLKRFMLYGDSDSMEKAMQQMCSLFAVAGGPLKYIFESALDRRVRHSPATNTVIDDGGIAGDIAGHRICAGTEEYMRRRGIAIPDTSAKSDFGIDTTKVMYAAEDGVIYAKFFIRYSFSEEFTMLLPTLKEEGIVPLVYTSDPNVSNELLRILSAGNDCMRVMRKYTPDEEHDVIYRNISAGVVCFGDKINAINVILLAKKYKKLISRFKSIELYAMGAGLGLGVLLSVLGMFAVPSFVFGIWQIAWCVVLAIMAKSDFSADKSDK